MQNPPAKKRSPERGLISRGHAGSMNYAKARITTRCVDKGDNARILARCDIGATPRLGDTGDSGHGVRLKKWPFARHGRSGRLSRLGSGRPPSRSDPTTKLGDNLPPGASSICESLPRRHSDAEAVVLVLPRWLTEGASQHSDA